MSRIRRRSKMSARAPAGSASTNRGRVVAACTSDTMSGDGASSVISHAAAESCIQVPMLEATSAIQSARNSGRRSGLQAEGAVMTPNLRCLDRLPQTALIPFPAIPLAVDKNGRRSFDAVRDAALNVPFHTLGEFVSGHGFEIRTHVDAGRRGPLLELGRLEVVLIGEQGVMHAPEGIRSRERGDGFCRLGRHLR